MRLRDGKVHTFGRMKGIAIGWLDFEDGEYEYPTPSPDDTQKRRELITALRQIQPQLVLHQRGMHICNLGDGTCGNSPADTWGGQEYVIEGNGKTYIAPSLLLHYILKHWYMPPADFVDAAIAQAKSGER